MTRPLLPANRIHAKSDLPAVLKEALAAQGEDTSWFVDIESPSYLSLQRVQRVLFSKKSKYQTIQIVDFEECGRSLILDGRLQQSSSDEHIYHEMFVHPAMVWGQHTSILILGGGDGCLIREILKWGCVERVVVVEIDQMVIDACREHCPNWSGGAWEDPRVEVLNKDAFDAMGTDEKFDLIFADLTEPYDDSGVAGDLSSKIYTPEFYETIKGKLTSSGMFAAQTGGIRLGNTPINQHHIKMVNGIRDVFGEVRVAYEFIPSYNAMWTATFASLDDFEDGTSLEDMWFSGERCGHEIDRLLVEGRVETKYYDGATNTRLFTPPIDDFEFYEWTE